MKYPFKNSRFYDLLTTVLFLCCFGVQAAEEISSPEEKSSLSSEKSEPESSKLQITGEQEKQLAPVPGVGNKEASQSSDLKPANSSSQQDSKAAVITAEKLAPELHYVQMKITGSMCYACLRKLERQVRDLQGVEKFTVDKPIQNYYQPETLDVANWASVVMIFDRSKVQLNQLRGFLRSQGYISYKVTSKLLDRPMESGSK